MPGYRDGVAIHLSWVDFAFEKEIWKTGAAPLAYWERERDELQAVLREPLVDLPVSKDEWDSLHDLRSVWTRSVAGNTSSGWTHPTSIIFLAPLTRDDGYPDLAPFSVDRVVAMRRMLAECRATSEWDEERDECFGQHLDNLFARVLALLALAGPRQVVAPAIETRAATNVRPCQRKTPLDHSH